MDAYKVELQTLTYTLTSQYDELIIDLIYDALRIFTYVLWFVFGFRVVMVANEVLKWTG